MIEPNIFIYVISALILWCAAQTIREAITNV